MTVVSSLLAGDEALTGGEQTAKIAPVRVVGVTVGLAQRLGSRYQRAPGGQLRHFKKSSILERPGGESHDQFPGDIPNYLPSWITHRFQMFFSIATAS